MFGWFVEGGGVHQVQGDGCSNLPISALNPHFDSVLYQVELMEQNEDIDRAMILHRRIRDLLDLQYKKLHVDLGYVVEKTGVEFVP